MSKEAWENSLKGYEDLILVNAHCDQRVLHRPTICQFCDKYPEAQAKRVELGVNFTGEEDPSLAPCPAMQARGADHLNAWGGNQPKGPGVPFALKQHMKSIESTASKVMYGPDDEGSWHDWKPNVGT